MMEIEAPFGARKAEPGQFIILRIDEAGERIPLTIADYDRENATRSPRQVAAAALVSTRAYTPSERGTLTNLAK